MFKLGLSSISPPTAFAVLGSVGAHALLGISLPVLPLFSKATPGPLEVPIVELSPEEMARIPALQTAPPVAFIPPNATQLLPLPPNFQLPAATPRPAPANRVASAIPATPAIPVTPKVSTSSLLPTRPSTGAAPYQYPTFTRPQRIVTRGRGGLPLTPSVPVGMGSRMGRTVASSEGLARGNRTIGSRTPEFVPNPNANPMGTLKDSLQQSFNQTPAQPLPVLQERGKDHTSPNEIGLVNPPNGSQGTTPTSPAVPLPVLTPDRGDLTPLKPSATPNTPENQPQEARNGSPSPAPSEPPQALPTPRGAETTRTNENRDRAPLPSTENRTPEPLAPPKVTTSTESNEVRNVTPRRQEPETPAPRTQQEAIAPRRQEQEAIPPRRQESRDRTPAESPAPQNSETRSNPPSPQPEVKKEKPVAQEGNETEPAQ